MLIPFLSQPEPMASEGVSYDQLTEEEKQVYKWFCMICRHHSKVNSCSTTALFWDISEGHW